MVKGARQTIILREDALLKQWMGDMARDAISSPGGVSIRRWLGLRSVLRSNHELYGIPIPADVVVYFGEVATKIYQLEQWLPVLEQLNEHHRVLLVFRRVASLRALRGRTKLPMIFTRNFENLMRLYDENDYKLCLYVNNGVSNFQSLNHARMVHVHVNHGESDKLSMVSNQEKAYDKIMIAGPAALERHRAVLVDFDESKLLMIGRPQLDVEPKAALTATGCRTIMYAPTWEGENEANNYTSLDCFGREIVRSLLGSSNTRVVYKPHPRIESTSSPVMAEAHSAIVDMIHQANQLGTNHHVISEQGNIISMFPYVDAVVTDVSSVGLDYLYLFPENPLILTDRRNDSERLERDAPISRACAVINTGTIGYVDQLIEGSLGGDSNRHQRLEMRKFYFGDVDRGQATDSFIDSLGRLMAERRKKLEKLSFHISSTESVDE